MKNSSTHHGDGAQFLALLFCYGEPPPLLILLLLLLFYYWAW